MHTRTHALTHTPKVYVGPQAWQLSLSGELSTSEAGSVMYGAAYPPHTKVAEGQRCIAFYPSTAVAPSDVDDTHAVEGRLVLVACDDDDAGDEQAGSDSADGAALRFARKWE